MMDYTGLCMNSVVYADFDTADLEDTRFLIFDNADIRSAISVMINCVK